jgi:CIC family chloride channel protein
VDPISFPHLHVDHPLGVALERMGATQLDVLPVVSRADIHKMEGVVTLKDVLDFYGLGPSCRD